MPGRPQTQHKGTVYGDDTGPIRVVQGLQARVGTNTRDGLTSAL